MTQNLLEPVTKTIQFGEASLTLTEAGLLADTALFDLDRWARAENIKEIETAAKKAGLDIKAEYDKEFEILRRHEEEKQVRFIDIRYTAYDEIGLRVLNKNQRQVQYFRLNAYPRMAACVTNDEYPSCDEAVRMKSEYRDLWYNAAHELNPHWFKALDAVAKRAEMSLDERKKKEVKPDN